MKVSIVALFEMPPDMFCADGDNTLVVVRTFECPAENLKNSIEAEIARLRSNQGSSAKLKGISHSIIPEG